MQRIEIPCIIASLAEAFPVDGWDHLAGVSDSLAAAGAWTAQIVELVISRRPTPVPGDKCRVAAPPEAETVCHPSAFAHNPPIFDLAGVVIGVRPVFITVLRDYLLIRHRIRLRTPDVNMRSIRCRIAGERVLGNVSADTGGSDGCISLRAEFAVCGSDLIQGTADKLRPSSCYAIRFERLEQLCDPGIELWRRHFADPPMRSMLAVGPRVPVYTRHGAPAGQRYRPFETHLHQPVQILWILDGECLPIKALQVLGRHHVQAIVQHCLVLVLGCLLEKLIRLSAVLCLVAHIVIRRVMLDRIFLERETHNAKCHRYLYGFVESIIRNCDVPAI